jgi:hypothetical protein
MTKKKTEEIIVQKIRFNGRSVACVWTQAGDTYNVTFHDKPLPSFVKALEALASHVCSLCELPSKDAEKVEPTGVTLLELGDDNQRAVIVAKKKIRKGKRVFNITTPLLALWEPKKSEEGAETADHMDEDTAKAIAKFESEAKRYIRNGPDDRAQGKLKLEEEPKPGEKKKGDNTTPFPSMDEPAGAQG